jgi:chitodextrinase
VVRAVDAAGNVSADSNTITPTTAAAPVPDTTAPSAPSGLAASNVAQTSLTLNWSASTDNVAVTGYRVLRNGVQVGTPTGTTFADSGLVANTTYTYVVRAVDAAGNVSADSNTITPTTLDVPPPTSSLFSTLFTGANGAGWGADWATTTSAGNVDIQNNAGRVAFNDTTGAYARAQLTGLAARTDADTLFSYQWNSTAGGAYFNAYVRGSGGWTNSYRPVNGYGLELSSGSTTVTFRRVSGGTTTNLASVTNANVRTTAKQWMRIRAVGSTIQFKTWVDGTTEPTTWRSTVTDTAVTAPGQFFVSNVRSGSNTGAKNVTIDDLTITAGS